MAKIKTLELKIPDLGEAESTEIIEINIEEGMEIDKNDPLIVLESEKAAMEVPSDFKGKIVKVYVKEGDAVKKDQIFATIESLESVQLNDQSLKVELNEEPTHKSTESKSAFATQPNINISSGINAGPAVRKYARELEIDLSKIKGTGRNGKITKEDLKQFIHSGTRGSSSYLEFNEESFKDFKNYSIEKQTKIEAISSKNLHGSWVSIPHVTHLEEADLESINSFSGKKKISILAIIIEASAKALKEYRKFNSSLVSGDRILYKQEINIGIAVDTPNGLVVPVLKGADKLKTNKIAESISVLADKARNKKLLLDDMKDATFTVSSLGKIGGVGFTPIINPPEVAILGVSRTKKVLAVLNRQVVEKEILPFSLSYDHRVINGADAGKFMYFIKEFIEKYYD